MISSEMSKAVADTLSAQKENVGSWISHHIQNSGEWHPLPGVHLHLPHFEPIKFLGMEFNLSITNHVIMLWISSLILLSLFIFLYKRKQKVPSGFGSMLEMLVVFIRDEVAIANMGEKEGNRFTPLLVTFFFFVLISNLLGLIPLFSTATGNINVNTF